MVYTFVIVVRFGRSVLPLTLPDPPRPAPPALPYLTPPCLVVLTPTPVFQAHDINALFGFRLECMERLGDEQGVHVWRRINDLFNYLPLAATIEGKILCMHGGIGRCINKIDQVGYRGERAEGPCWAICLSCIILGSYVVD